MKKKTLSVFTVAIGIIFSGYVAGSAPSVISFEKQISLQQNPLADEWQTLRGQWSIVDGIIQAKRNPAENNANNLLMVQKEQIKNSSFSISAKIKSLSTAKANLVGVAFHVQDVDNYYAFRFNTSGEEGWAQLVRVVGGKAQQLAMKKHGGAIKENEFYTVKVSSSSPFVFNWSVTDSQGSIVLEGTSKDMLKTYTDGTTGLYTLAMGHFVDFSQ